MRTKKLLIVLMVALLVFAMGACGKKAADSSSSDSPAGDTAAAEDTATEEAASSSGGGGLASLDLEGEGRQPISDERVTLEKLKEVAAWANDMGDDKFKLTYADFKAQLGVDANEYEWTGMNGAYFWYPSDEDGPYLSPVFTGGDGVLFALGGMNVS